MQEITFQRSLKLKNVIGNPSLVIFSDGSEEAIGTYLCWELESGSFTKKLIISKSRVTPLSKMTIVRSELCGAAYCARIRKFIANKCRFTFQKEFFIVDSEIVKAEIQTYPNVTYGFNSFVAIRIGEIQEKIDKAKWCWVPGKPSIADWITRC